MTLCGVHDNMHAHATTVTHTCLPTIPPPPHYYQFIVILLLVYYHYFIIIVLRPSGCD